MLGAPRSHGQQRGGRRASSRRRAGAVRATWLRTAHRPGAHRATQAGLACVLAAHAPCAAGASHQAACTARAHRELRRVPYASPRPPLRPAATCTACCCAASPGPHSMCNKLRPVSSSKASSRGTQLNTAEIKPCHYSAPRALLGSTSLARPAWLRFRACPAPWPHMWVGCACALKPGRGRPCGGAMGQQAMGKCSVPWLCGPLRRVCIRCCQHCRLGARRDWGCGAELGQLRVQLSCPVKAFAVRPAESGKSAPAQAWGGPRAAGGDGWGLCVCWWGVPRRSGGRS